MAGGGCGRGEGSHRDGGCVTRARQTLETLGGRIRYARTCRRYTAAVFCRLAEVEPWQLVRWETGTGPLQHSMLRALAYFLEVPIQWLVTGEGEPPCRPLTEAEKIMAEVDIGPETRLRRLAQARPKLRDLPDL